MPVMIYTVQKVIDQIASEIGDRGMRFVTLQDHVDNINLGIIKVSVATKSIDTKFYTFMVVAGDYEFDLPRDFIRGDVKTLVMYDGKALGRHQFGEHVEQSGNLDAGEPTDYAIRRNKLIIYPPCSSEFAGKRLDIHCGQLADAVTEDHLSDPMPVPTEMVPYVIDFARAKAWRKRRKTTRADSATMESERYLKDLKDISTDIHREEPMRFMTEQEALRLGELENFRTNNR